MKCAKCGAEVPQGSRFCASCGLEVTSPDGATVTLATAEAEQDPLLLQLRTDLAKDYEVEKELGRGGMAVVYQATEIELRRKVALKVLPPGTGGGTMAERFKREARMAAALDHANIIPIYRVGQAAGTYFFAMKFVEGRAVDAIIESQGALPVPVILAILRGSVSALAFAHERNIIHRDIKGANILIDRDGRVLVSDFGIARAAEEKTLTASGSVIGTPHFMSPEQCSGSKVGPQSDQYSMGILTFQMLTGSVPFDADTLMAVLQHHFFTPVPDIRAVREEVPDGLIEFVNRALAKDATGRWGSTREMLRAVEAVQFSDAERVEAEEMLRELAQGTPVPKVRTGSLPPLADTRTLAAAALSAAPTVAAGPIARKPAKRSRAPLVAAAAVLVVGAGAAAGWYFTMGPGAARQQAQDSTAAGPSVAPSLPVVSAPAAPVLGDSAARESTALPMPSPVSAEGLGTIRLSGLPAGATVRLDGQAVQGTTLRRGPGRYRLEVTAEGYAPFSRRVTVRAGEVQQVTVRMEPRATAQAPPTVPGPGAQTPPTREAAAPQPAPAEPSGGTATLRLRTVPPTAQILLNGRAAGVGSIFDYEVRAGSVRIRVSAPGYVTWDTSFTVEAGAEVRLGTKTLRSTEGGP
ncbi:MAG: hypothetical protein A2083_03845 [Gemmatimonadetes bacterium GWC2_71_9]|nr:MAG: hypothetical protein A2083_03845 [Gemmatimonadetes bacterium GWC2_71_9]